MRLDYRLLAAAIVPLLVVWWVPPWADVVLGEGLAAAAIFVSSVAILEEVIFRGAIQSWLLARPKFQIKLSGLSRANWLTSTLFVVAHLWQHPVQLAPGYLAVSLLFGYFRERYRGITVPLILHVHYNLMLLLLPALSH
ncbi:MAG: JDVT-CTERM system glutamic-type intramembrane protease [Sideroxydans sp.]|nr:JDVT-CTERM system glutamic-type intramembrane protease [Sideroxydans sp.]